MEDFRNFKKSKNFKQLVIQVSDNEEEADALYVEVIRNLHVNHADEPMHVLKWSRLYAFMESCCDACEHTRRPHEHDSVEEYVGSGSGNRYTYVGAALAPPFLHWRTFWLGSADRGRPLRGCLQAKRRACSVRGDGRRISVQDFSLERVRLGRFVQDFVIGDSKSVVEPPRPLPIAKFCTNLVYPVTGERHERFFW